MINRKNYQGSVFINSTSQFTGSINKAYSDILDYFTLKKTNELLFTENEYLKNLKFTRVQFDSIPQPPDTIYRYIGAKIISKSIHKPDNYLMLDKGAKNGVKIDMAVVSGDGIVGSVIAVSENYCSVMSVLHSNSKISAKIKKNNQLANILWGNTNYSKGTLEDIPSHLELLYGDSIVTSGYSLIFPENILIGTVENYFSEAGLNLNKAIIKFSTDYNSLKYVYIIENLRKDEQMMLKREVENE